jgi:DnaJ family protein C protein 7
MSGSNSMDIDREPVNGASPGSPPQNLSAQTNFSVPIPNGNGNEETASGDGEAAPAPPPHGSNPSSPIQSPQEEAEELKAAGNRLFKDKKYAQAIAQYTKGMNSY